jgi:peptidase S41-like protein
METAMDIPAYSGVEAGDGSCHLDSRVAMPRYSTIRFLLCAAFAVPVGAQAPAAVAPTCAQDFDSLHSRIEADYAGYVLEVAPHPERYQAELVAARSRAASATTDRDCLRALNGLVTWFNDPHLFLYQSGAIDTAEVTRRARAVEKVSLDESGARAYFASRNGKLDPIEGIWYDGPLRVAVVPENRAQPKGPFIAVVLKSDTSIWEAGAVRARFTPRATGGYDADLWARNYALKHLDGEIYRGLLLRFSPGMWGKAYPIAAGDSGLLDPVDAHRATLVTRDGTLIVSIPSHDPTYQAPFDALIAAHAAELKNAPRLIVDLRGNEGGSSGMSESLLPYLLTAGPPVSNGYRQMMLLSSPDQIAYARRVFGPDTIPENRHRLDRMAANPGRLVALVDSADSVPPDRPDSAIIGPARVGILIDRGTVSASEVVVQRARRSSRVTVFGENTAGALDYENVSIVPFLKGESRWYLGYPTITASAALPAGGMRGKGIAPDVRLNLATTRDAIAVVDRALRAPRR